VTRYDGWDDAAEAERAYGRLLHVEKQRALSKQFPEVPAEDSVMLSPSQRLALKNACTCGNGQGCLIHDPPASAGVTVTFTVAEADAAHLAVSRYSTMFAGHYARGEISTEAYGALLSAREVLYRATLGARSRSPVDVPRVGE
jgi:hypothetical protein